MHCIVFSLHFVDYMLRLLGLPHLQVTGTLREYQMLGLSWLVKCYDHGINAILADEMVRLKGEGGKEGVSVGTCL